ncbi:endolysin [Mycobacterium phage Cintron]|uniref:Lysin A n=1 Tax=Mycobacterium phage Cintron TaxID=2686232 RepID=A0A6B9LKF0_9CAUD|nr:endolysin [Mycobacterium phage Cintron]QHB37949.1 lysin A [Mycobacterium phage Cintron]
MARRLFRGRAFSENGWPYVDQGSCTWDEVVPGVWLQIQNGPPFTVLRAFARDFHAHVEPLRDPDSACWTQDNTVDTSNHPGGTAMDLNWQGADGKTFRYGISEERAYPSPKRERLRELLDFYEGVVFCGGFWSIQDWMHFQMGAGTYDSKADRPTEKTLDFIRRKIRPDGFSTFKRGGGGSAAPDAASVLARAADIPLAKAQEILPTFREGAVLAECTTVPRLAMFIAQTCWESDRYRATEEYANGPMNEERWIYKGRTWIQLTWRSAYEGFGRWCHARGLVNDPMVFVNNPRSLADLRWAGLGAAYYWTTTVRNTRKYPTLNQASDARDVLVATQIVNGGTTHLAERTAIYNRAIALGDELLHILGEEDELANPEIERMIREVHACLFNRIVSQSIYRDPRNPDGSEPPGNVWQLHELIKNGDGMIHQRHVEDAARGGNLIELDRIARVARGQGAVRDQWAIEHAQRFIAELEVTRPEVLQRYLAWKGAA